MEQTKAFDPKVARPFTPLRPIRRIGLISPYAGGNIGNTTLISALIANIHKRIAGVEILGITLSPSETRLRLGIEGYPLAGFSRPYYTLCQPGISSGGQPESVKVRRAKEWSKQIPVLRIFVKVMRYCYLKLLSLFHMCSRPIRNGYAELSHFAAAGRMVRSLDRIIVAGGGPLDESWGGPWGHPWSLLKWSVLSRANGVPFMFVSVGKSILKHPLSRLFVRVALRLAEYRSYRDNYSKSEVLALIRAHDDPVYPDLAFSYRPPAVRSLAGDGLQDGRLVVGVSPIAYCDPRVWPQKDGRLYAAYIGQLAEMVHWLTKEGHRVLFFTTDSPDTTAVNDVKSALSNAGIDTGKIQSLPGTDEQTPDSLLQGIAGAHLIIASRLHGVILSHFNHIPVLAVSFDPKVDAHMNDIGQGEYCLSIEFVQCDKLIERFTALKAARQREHARLLAATARYRSLLDEQYEQILGLTHVGPNSGPANIDTRSAAESSGSKVR